MEPAQFTDLVATITRRIAGKPLDANLESELNAAYSVDSGAFRDVFEACRAGIAAGWIWTAKRAVSVTVVSSNRGLPRMAFRSMSSR